MHLLLGLLCSSSKSYGTGLLSCPPSLAAPTLVSARGRGSVARGAEVLPVPSPRVRSPS